MQPSFQAMRGRDKVRRLHLSLSKDDWMDDRVKGHGDPPYLSDPAALLYEDVDRAEGFLTLAKRRAVRFHLPVRMPEVVFPLFLLATEDRVSTGRSSVPSS